MVAIATAKSLMLRMLVCTFEHTNNLEVHLIMTKCVCLCASVCVRVWCGLPDVFIVLPSHVCVCVCVCVCMISCCDYNAVYVCVYVCVSVVTSCDLVVRWSRVLSSHYVHVLCVSCTLCALTLTSCLC